MYPNPSATTLSAPSPAPPLGFDPETPVGRKRLLADYQLAVIGHRLAEVERLIEDFSDLHGDGCPCPWCAEVEVASEIVADLSALGRMCGTGAQLWVESYIDSDVRSAAARKLGIDLDDDSTGADGAEDADRTEDADTPAVV